MSARISRGLKAAMFQVQRLDSLTKPSFIKHLSSDKYLFVALRKDVNKKSVKTLADYYYRTNKHLLNGVFVIEIDISDKSVGIRGDLGLVKKFRNQ